MPIFPPSNFHFKGYSMHVKLTGIYGQLTNIYDLRLVSRKRNESENYQLRHINQNQNHRRSTYYFGRSKIVCGANFESHAQYIYLLIKLLPVRIFMFRLFNMQHGGRADGTRHVARRDGVETFVLQDCVMDDQDAEIRLHK